MWLDEWFRNYIQPSSKIKTCERYSEIIEKHLKVKLGEYELDELTPLVLQRYITELLRSGNKIIWLFLLYTKIIALYCHCRDTPTAVQRKDSTPTFHVMVSTGAYIGASVRSLSESKQTIIIFNRQKHG